MNVRSLFFIVAFASVGIGTFRGYATGRWMFSPGVKSKMTVLAPKGYFPASLFSQFSRDNRVEVKLQEYDGAEEFRRTVTSPLTVDLVVADAELATELIRARKLLRLDKTRIPNFENLDRDFRFTPYDQDCEFTVPLLWGVNSPATKSGTTLWFQTIGIPAEKTPSNATYLFFDFLLRAETAKELSRLTKLAGTNRLLEVTDLPDSLKPSFLRAFPLRAVRFPSSNEARKVPATF